MTLPFLVLAALGVVFYLLACLATLRFRAGTLRSFMQGFPAVTFLKPFKGLEPDFARNLESFARIDGGDGGMQFLFACSSEDDPGLPTVREFCARHADSEVRVVTDRPGANEKVNNLVGVASLARHDLLVISDSDVRIEEYLGAGIDDFLADQDVGVSSCPYRVRGISTLGGLLEASWIGLEFIPSVFLAATLFPVRFTLGATIFLRKEVLKTIGGFESIRDYLADDYQLGLRAARVGWKVRLAPMFVEIWAGPVGLRESLLRQVRWARTIRICNPAGHFFSVLSRPIPFALLGALLEPRSSWALGAVVATFSARIATAVVNAFAQGCDVKVVAAALLSPLQEILSTVVWLLSWGGRTVVWRGRRFELDAEGRLVRTGS